MLINVRIEISLELTLIVDTGNAGHAELKNVGL